MKLIIISDTHNLHDHITIPDGDILIHCGDICGKPSSETIINFDRWLEKLPHKHKIIIAGNHDFPFEMQPRFFKQLKNCLYLQDSFVSIDKKNLNIIEKFDLESNSIFNYSPPNENTIKFYGSPWQPRFFNWAFNLNRGKEIKNIWNKIPKDTDVLITHGPPFGILDTCPDIYKQNVMVNVGCEELLKRVKEIKPKIHCFGHIHEDYGTLKDNEITFINASICNREYLPINKPIEIEI